jgi:hypothetical protein
VGLAAVGGGLGGAGNLGVGGGDWGSVAARSMVANAITQGIGVATGMQKDFSWAGVAAAGVGVAVRANFNVASPFNVANSSAQLIADAATRSLIEGSDFGDNIMAALPNVIGQTIGEMVAGGISRRAERVRPEVVAALKDDAAQVLADNPELFGGSPERASEADIARWRSALVEAFPEATSSSTQPGARLLGDMPDGVLRLIQDNGGWPEVDPGVHPNRSAAEMTRRLREALGFPSEAERRAQERDAEYQRRVERTDEAIRNAERDIALVLDLYEVSPTALAIIQDFQSGAGERVRYFGPDSDAVRELFSSNVASFYETWLTEATDFTRNREGGYIPNGTVMTNYTGGPDFFLEGAIGLSDGRWDMSDMVGTPTLGIRRMEAVDGILRFTMVNRTSLSSYAGENLLRHGNIIEPTPGQPYSAVTQVFTIERPNPYLPPSTERRR